MIEKVNPSHPDKIADRIAGSIVDIAYKNLRNLQSGVYSDMNKYIARQYRERNCKNADN